MSLSTRSLRGECPRGAAVLGSGAAPASWVPPFQQSRGWTASRYSQEPVSASLWRRLGHSSAPRGGSSVVALSAGSGWKSRVTVATSPGDPPLCKHGDNISAACPVGCGGNPRRVCRNPVPAGAQAGLGEGLAPAASSVGPSAGPHRAPNNRGTPSARGKRGSERCVSCREAKARLVRSGGAARGPASPGLTARTPGPGGSGAV